MRVATVPPFFLLPLALRKFFPQMPQPIHGVISLCFLDRCLLKAHARQPYLLWTITESGTQLNRGSTHAFLERVTPLADPLLTPPRSRLSISRAFNC